MQFIRRIIPNAQGRGGKSAMAEPPNSPSREELITIIQSFPHWYQRIYLGHNTYTLDGPAHHEEVWRRLQAAFPPDLGGASVLDVGCNAGYFSIKAKMGGAGRVVGIEFVDFYLKQAELCRDIWGLDIEYLPLDAHQVGRVPGVFDIVVFTGILYHLKNPLQVLEEVYQKCQDAILVETEIIADDPRNCVIVRQGPLGQPTLTQCRTGVMKFIEADELNGDGSNWWVPDTECVMGMLRAVGFRYFSAPCYLNENRLLLIASKKSRSVLNLEAVK